MFKYVPNKTKPNNNNNNKQNRTKKTKPKPPPWLLYKTQKLLVLEVQAKMCPEHINSIWDNTYLLSEEEKGQQRYKVLDKYCKYLL